MLLDEKRPIAENEAPKDVEQVSEQAVEPAQDVPLITKEEFAAQMQRLAERARAAGLNPIRALAQTYIKQGVVMLDSILGALENRASPRKKE